MSNYRLDYISLYREQSDEIRWETEVLLKKHDDGETTTVKEARDLIIPILQKRINDLQELLADIKGLGIVKLKEKYNQGDW